MKTLTFNIELELHTEHPDLVGANKYSVAGAVQEIIERGINRDRTAVARVTRITIVKEEENTKNE